MAVMCNNVRANPFRFWAPAIKAWLYPFFKWQNLYFLHIVFKLRHIHIHPSILKGFHQIHSSNSTLIVANHISFMDPHVLFELSFRSKGPKVYWMAGIEPFEKPIMSWHIRSVGAFSIDRGITDKRALAFAQQTLETGKYPLIIFPEGEATYQPTKLAPFYAGAGLMALQCAMKYADTPNHRVSVLPLTMVYRFVKSPEATMRKDIQKLYLELQRACLNKVHPTPPKLQTHLAVPGQLLELTQAAWHTIYPMYEADGFQPLADSAPLIDQLEHLKRFLVGHLLRIYLHDEPVEYPNDYESLMNLKNRIRSQIIRQLNAPELNHLDTITTQLASPTLNPKQLSKIETEWLGVVAPNDPVEKRINRLTEALAQQRSYAQKRHQATEEQLTLLKQHAEDTRRIKLLALVIDDIKTNDTRWESLDGWLVKLELLTFQRFVYRGTKDIYLYSGELLDIKTWIAQQGDVKKRELMNRLTHQLRNTIEGILTKSLSQDPFSLDNRLHANPSLAVGR